MSPIDSVIRKWLTHWHREQLKFALSKPVPRRMFGKVLPASAMLPTEGSKKKVKKVHELAAHSVPYRSVSLDIFDTIIERIHANPELIKPRVARFLHLLLSQESIPHDKEKLEFLRTRIEWHLCERSAAKDDDPESKLSEIAAALFSVLGAEDRPDLVEKWLRYELESELGWMMPIKDARETIEKLTQAGKRVFLLSDMYLDEALVEELLDKLGLNGLVEKIYVSSDQRKGKYSGKLFEHLKSEHGVSLDQHLHIGDSMRSDVAGPAKKGVSSLWLARPKVDPRMSGSFEGFFNGWLARRTLKSGAEGYRVGYDLLGPAFVAYTLQLLDYAVSERADAILFLAREGDLFLELAKQIWEATPRYQYFEKPRLEYAYISRQSCSPATLKEAGHAEIEFTHYRRPPFTLRKFCESYGVNELKIKPIADRYFVSIHESIPWDDHRLERVLKDTEFRKICREYGIEHRKLLLDYLKSLGVSNGSTVVLSDMGWSGTIQLMLDRVLRNEPNRPKLRGFYAGVLWKPEYDFTKPESTVEPGFLFDSRKHPSLIDIFNGLKPILEISATAKHGSTTHYERDADGKVQPVFSEPHEDFSDGRDNLHAGIADFCRDFLPEYAKFEWSATEIRDCVFPRIVNELGSPSAAVARELGKLTQSVDWGSKEFIHLVPPGTSKLDWVLPWRAKRRVHEAIWPAGAIRQLGLSMSAYEKLMAFRAKLK